MSTLSTSRSQVQKTQERKSAQEKLKQFLRNYPFCFALAASVLMLAINLVMQPSFNATIQLASFAPLALAAIATAPSMLSGGIDLSISPQMVFASIIFIGYLVPSGLDGFIAVPILIALGLVLGGINGLIVVVLRVPAIVASLATMFILSGVNLRLAPAPLNLSSSWVQSLGGSIWIIPGGLLTIGVALALWWGFMVRTSLGRNVYAVGGNDTTAYSAGVPVAKTKITAYMFGGALAAIGGLALTGLTSSIDATSSQAYILVALTAITLGGIQLGGGRGGVVGALCGAAVIYLVQNMLSVFQVSTTWMNLVYGALLLVAVVMTSVLSPKKKRN